VALIGIVVIKAVLLLAVKPGSFSVSYSGITYFLLLVLATSFAIRNGIQNTLGSRPFWGFLAIGCGLWSLHQSIYLYYELGLHVEVPDTSIADPILFLHIVPFMAALAVFPQRNASAPKPYRAIVDALLLFFFWSFLYGYIVFPYRYAAASTSYGQRFDYLYLIENAVLVLAAGVVTLRGTSPWKSIDLHLFGATALYALSSAVANLAIDSGGYANGKLYGLGLTASVCWFVWLPLRARQLSGTEAGVSEPNSKSWSSWWAMLTVVVISIPFAWELLSRDASRGARTFRLLVAIAAIVCVACVAYIRELLVSSELASRLGFADNRLRLAMKSGKIVGWEWSVKTGQDVWFGDLQTQFGIPSDTYVGRPEDFHRRVHPEDRERVMKAVKDAMQNRTPYAAQFRIVRLDGTVRWVSAEGEFYYEANGRVERMLGISVDITVRKLAEEALANMSRRVSEAEELERRRIAQDLHENIGQRLALLAIEIEQLKTEPLNQTVEMLGRLDAISKQTLGILTDVKASAHELHSPRLKYLGIAAVMRSFCEEFGLRKGVEIDFRSHDVPSSVPPNISLCLFRVLQEALYNAVKHSGARHFEVRLWRLSDDIHLTFSDSGAGFDPEAARNSGGLGLLGIEERLKLLKGTVSIESQPQRGTTIHGRVPLSSRSDTLRAAG
jgi:PAS domain S-box-containing protein